MPQIVESPLCKIGEGILLAFETQYRHMRQYDYRETTLLPARINGRDKPAAMLPFLIAVSGVPNYE